MKKSFARVISVLMVMVLMYSVCAVGVSAIANVSSASLISTYGVDFENGYLPTGDRCTSSSVIDDNGNKVLSLKLNSSKTTNRFEIYNAKMGDLVLNDGKIYAVSITYKVVRIGGDGSDTKSATSINLVRYTGKGDELVKIKSFPDATYLHGDTTEWVTSTVVFKASVASSPEYNRIAINVVSPTCPEIESNIESNTTLIYFDNITVQECSDNTKSIEFVSNGGSYCDPILAGAGEGFDLPTPTRDLYKFAGWYSNIELTKQYKKSTMPSNLTTKLYAKWDIADDAVTVKYVSNNGTTIETSVGRAGDKLTLPTLTRVNCNFAGWFDKEYKTRYSSNSFPEKSITLYAKWELIPQMCSFENVEDFPKPDNGVFTQRCLLGDDKYKTKKDAYKSNTALHYSFQRGYDLTGSAGKGTPAGVRLVDENGQAVKLTAGKTYVITFKYKVIDYISSNGMICLIAAGGGAWSDRKVQDYRTSSVRYNADDEKKGWQTATFTHTWQPANEAGSYCYIAIAGESEVYVDDVLIYEKDKNFSVKSDKMMLCFDTGIAPMIDTVYAARGTEVTLPVLEMEGYRFLGWTRDEDRLDVVESETVKLDTMYTKLYADWYKIPPVVDEPEDEPVVQTKPEPEPKPQGEKSNNMLYVIIIAAAAVVVIAGVIVVIIVKKKKKK